MYCSKCGNPIDKGAEFCSHCGERNQTSEKDEKIVSSVAHASVIKKSDKKKKSLFMIMTIVILVGIAIVFFVLNKPVSGPEVLFNLEWGMTSDQVKAVDNNMQTQEFDTLNDEQVTFLSSIDYSYMHISSEYGGAVITYNFGVNNSLEHIQIQYMANDDLEYDEIMKKLEKYYNAVLKTSPTIGKAEFGDNDLLIWSTATNQISVGGDFDSTDYVFVKISPIASYTSNEAQIEDQDSSLTFEQVVTVQPTYFQVIGNEFSVESVNSNYYGEITVGTRNYIEGASNDISGTYALFIIPEGSNESLLSVVLHKDGFINSMTDLGTVSQDSVAYPFPNNLITNMYSLYGGSSFSLYLNNLSYSQVVWSQSQTVYSDANFNMLSCTITEKEAIRYAQDGTLPNCLQGLTVIGLDQIIQNPNQ